MANIQTDNSIFKFAATRPVTISMITFGILLFGFLSYQNLSLSLMPDITYPSLTVRTEYAGSAPEEVETSISRPVEEALGVVTSLVAISSVSKAGQSDVILEFNWDTDMNQAMTEVRERLDQVFLPDGSTKPIILKYDPSLDPIIRLSLVSGNDLFYDRFIAEEQLKRILEKEEGVAAVKVKGGYEEEIRVELDENKITLMGMDIQQIRQRLAQENVNLAGGELKEGQTEYIVRTLNEFKTLDEIRETRVGFENFREVRLGDIGSVFKASKERQLITRLAGKESVELEVYKEADANIVEVSRNVRAKVFGTPQQQMFVKNMREKAKIKPKDGVEPEEKKAEEPAPGGRGGPGGFSEEMLKRRMTDYLVFQLEEKNMNMELLTDQSVFIENSIDEVKSTAIWGGLLAVIVLFLFLNSVPTTIIVGLAIPISIVATFAPMRFFDVSLNIMSLGGLALGIGMLVDNSIVVTESIFRCREEGDSFVDSVVRGTKEVGGAVTASTLTTIAVFFPMVFVEGVAGQIFGDLSLTVVFSLLASLGIALFFIPMLSSREFNFASRVAGSGGAKGFFLRFNSWDQLKKGFSGARGWFRDASLLRRFFLIFAFAIWLVYALFRFILFTLFTLAGKVFTLLFILFGFVSKLFSFIWEKLLRPLANMIVAIFNFFYNRISAIYPPTIEWALGNRLAVLFIAIAPFILAVFVLLPRLGSELIPEVHQGEFNVELTLPIGTPVERTAQVVAPIEEMLLAQPDVVKVSTVAGVDLTKVSDSESGEHTAKITVMLTPGGNMAEVEERVLTNIRSKLSSFSGMDYKISRPGPFSFKTPVEVEIRGYNLRDLIETSRQAVNALTQVPGLTDVKSNLQRGSPEVQIIYDRVKLARYGLNVLDVANLVRSKVLGEVATQFKKDERRIDVRIKVRDQDKDTIEQLRRLNINPGGDLPISLQSVSSIEIAEGPSEIRRINQERSALILANISGRSLSSVSEDVFATMSALRMPAGFDFEITGQNKEMEVSLNSLKMALLLAIFMVYIVMASQFESFIHPFVILFTVPFALIGVILMLFALQIPLNIMVFLGLIMLAGIVVNNAIVLVDYINQLRQRGLDKAEAIKQAGMARLRPILMTTMTTVLGLLPMALGLGEGAEIRTPMAITVIAGLLSATFLTLVVIPTVYAVFTGDKIPEAKAGLEPAREGGV